MADQMLRSSLTMVPHAKPERYNTDSEIPSRPYSPPAVTGEPFVFPVRLSQFHLLQRVNETDELNTVDNGLERKSLEEKMSNVVIGSFRRTNSSPALSSFYQPIENPKKKIPAEIYKQQVEWTSPAGNSHQLRSLHHANLDGEGYTSAKNKQTSEETLKRFSRSSRASKSLPVTPITTPQTSPKLQRKTDSNNNGKIANGSTGEVKSNKLETPKVVELSTSPRRSMLHYFGLGSGPLKGVEGNRTLQNNVVDQTDGTNQRLQAYNATAQQLGKPHSVDHILPSKIHVRSKDLNVFAPGPM